MAQIRSQLNPRSADFEANAQAMSTLVDELRTQVAQSAQGGGQAARDKHSARGKLLPRERIQMLIDPGTSFLELSPWTSTTTKPHARVSSLESVGSMIKSA